MPLLLLLLLLVYNTQANQFLGTVMTYYPETPNADGSVTVGLRYKLNFQSCTDLRWQCLTGNCGNESVVVNNVSMDSTGDWCQTEGISTRQVPSNAPFQLWLNGSSWIDNITNGIVSWRAVTLVELRNRSDTSQANASPQTTILPTVRIPSNCQRDFSLLAFDPDGDNVQCRNGNTSLSECNPCTPPLPSVLSLSSSCTLSFSPTSSSNEGPYAVQLVMEDFPRQTITLTETNGAQTTLTTNDAISKIPLQFVLWVDPVVPSCAEGLYLPQFLPPTPTNGAQLYTLVNQSLEINIKADANISTVSELLFSGPYNVIQNTSGPGQFTLRWRPSQSEDGESFPICFVVKAVHNLTTYQSNLRYIIVSVGSNPAINTTVSSNLTPSLTLPGATTTDTSTITSTPPPSINGTDTPPPNTTNTSTITSTTPPPINGTDTPPPNTTNTSTVTSTAPPPINGTTTPPPNTTNTSTITSTAPPPINDTTTPPPNTIGTSTITSTPPPPTNATVIPTSGSTTPTPSTSTPTTQMNSAAYVVGLSVKLSSLVPLSTLNITSTLQQVQNTLVLLGLPSDITVRIVSIVQQ